MTLDFRFYFITKFILGWLRKKNARNSQNKLTAIYATQRSNWQRQRQRQRQPGGGVRACECPRWKVGNTNVLIAAQVCCCSCCCVAVDVECGQRRRRQLALALVLTRCVSFTHSRSLSFSVVLSLSEKLSWVSFQSCTLARFPLIRWQAQCLCVCVCVRALAWGLLRAPSPPASHHTLWWVRSRLPWATTRFFQDSAVLWWEIVARSWVLFFAASCAALRCAALLCFARPPFVFIAGTFAEHGGGRGEAVCVWGVWVAVRPSTLLPRWNAVGETSKLHLPTAKRCERFSWVFSSIFQAANTFLILFFIAPKVLDTLAGAERERKRAERGGSSGRKTKQNKTKANRRQKSVGSWTHESFLWRTNGTALCPATHTDRHTHIDTHRQTDRRTHTHT